MLGLTAGVRHLADQLSSGQHRIHIPDLYEGQVAATLQEGFAIRKEIGDITINARIEDALHRVGDNIVYAGISMGVMTAQRLAQARPDAVGALFYEACVPISGENAFGPWPNDLRVQIHGMDDDEFFAHEGDLDAAREIVDVVGTNHAELFTYPGDQHLFMDSSLATYNAEAAQLAIERSRDLLAAIG